MKQTIFIKQVLKSLTLFGLFIIFTALLREGYLNGAEYSAVFAILVALGLALYFSDRIKEISLLGKAVIKLYEKSREGLTVDKLAIDVSRILAQLSKDATGTARQRQEREAKIDELLKKARASKKEHEEILRDAKLITKYMGTNDKEQLSQLEKEIDRQGLLD